MRQAVLEMLGITEEGTDEPPGYSYKSSIFLDRSGQLVLRSSPYNMLYKGTKKARIINCIL